MNDSNRLNNVPGRNDFDLTTAEQRAELSRRRLEGSLDRLDGVIHSKVNGTAGVLDSKVSGVVEKARAKADMMRDRLDTSAEQIDKFVDEGQQELNQRLEQIRGVIDRVKLNMDGSIQKLDQMTSRVEGTITTVRDDFLKTSEEVVTRVEGVTRNAQSRFSMGVSEITRMIDLADGIVNDLSDPARLINRNPRALVPVLFIGGLVIGLFFRGYFVEGRSVNSRDRVRPMSGIPATGVVPPNAGAKEKAA